MGGLGIRTASRPRPVSVPAAALCAAGFGRRVRLQAGAGSDLGIVMLKSQRLLPAPATVLCAADRVRQACLQAQHESAGMCSICAPLAALVRQGGLPASK